MSRDGARGAKPRARASCVRPKCAAPSRARHWRQVTKASCWRLWSRTLERSWLAFMNAHSRHAAARPQRRKPCQSRFSLWALVFCGVGPVPCRPSSWRRRRRSSPPGRSPLWRAGETVTVTVVGRPVTELGPTHRRRWVSGAILASIWRRKAPRELDADLEHLPVRVVDPFAS